MIKVEHVTKDYGDGKGVFDLTFSVKEGEVLGFLGPNGSGKTTTIRQLMGFVRPDCGRVTICGMDCFERRDEIQRMLGYLPGEIAFLDEMTGMELIRFLAELKQVKDLSYAKKLISFLELDPTGKIKRMSKGMKQKIGLVIAFMQDSPILILDEPTSGLDPLMQNRFVELIREAKRAGKTILMSSHMFEEIEQTCDRVVMIKEGHLVAVREMQELRESCCKKYEIHFRREEDAVAFVKTFPNATRKAFVVSLLQSGRVNDILRSLSQYEIVDLRVNPQSLEELFLQYYEGGGRA